MAIFKEEVVEKINGTSWSRLLRESTQPKGERGAKNAQIIKWAMLSQSRGKPMVTLKKQNTLREGEQNTRRAWRSKTWETKL